MYITKGIISQSIYQSLYPNQNLLLFGHNMPQECNNLGEACSSCMIRSDILELGSKDELLASHGYTYTSRGGPSQAPDKGQLEMLTRMFHSNVCAYLYNYLYRNDGMSGRKWACVKPRLPDHPDQQECR